MRKAGEIVHDIQQCSHIQDALDRYTEEALSLGLSTAWMRSVFSKKRPLPVLDTSFDVQGTGVDVLGGMGISAEAQTAMWNNWALFDDDIKASWVKDFKELVFRNPEMFSNTRRCWLIYCKTKIARTSLFRWCISERTHRRRLEWYLYPPKSARSRKEPR